MSSILEPLGLFGADSPIPAVFLNHLVAIAAAAMPGYGAAAADAQGAFRLFVQHAIAAHASRDALEAMLAASLVTLHVQAAEAFRRANHPHMTPALARASRSLGTSMTRLLAQGERQLRIVQAERDKAPRPRPETAASAGVSPAPAALAAVLRAGSATAPSRRAGAALLRVVPSHRGAATAEAPLAGRRGRGAAG